VIYEIDSVVPPSAADVFSINEKSGEIRLRGALDFEAVTLYDLQVKAKDKGTGPEAAAMGECGGAVLRVLVLQA
ncbi:PCDAA protein, partial [Campylorhamphus procurvoides]|nr:PCDAA protein [Campylorhamphus procurvoides]